MPDTPSADGMYLSVPGPRAVFQGDVYCDVPFTKASAGDTRDRDPKWAAKRSHVAPILYPCDLVAEDNVSLIRAQPIVLVYDAAARGLSIAADLEDVTTGVCPLPDLEGDGRMWVADFRCVSVVDRFYLGEENRVRCLSEYGWAIFRQRLATSTSRAEIEIDVLLDLGSATWLESELETRWVEASRDRPSFHGWLDTERSDIGEHVSYRDALEAGELGLVRRAVEDELAADQLF